MSATCSSCGAAIVWAVTEKGRPAPIDAEPVPNGNIELVPDADPREPPTAVYLDKNGLRTLSPSVAHWPLLRYQSHFASCPHSDQHRKVR